VTGARARAAALALACWFALPACNDGHAARAGRAPAVATTRVFLGDDFEVSPAARCRVTGARLVLTEPSVPEGSPQAAEDVRVARLELACRDAREQPLEPRAALTDAALIRLADSRGRELAPSPRTRETEHSPEALVFELDGAADVLPRPRRFDPRSGAALAAPEHGVGTLHVKLHDRHIAVLLRESFRDARLDRFLSHTALALARGAASEPLARIGTLHAQVIERFAPRALTLTRVEPHGAGLRVELALQEARRPGAPEPVLVYTLGLARGADGELALQAVDEPEGAARTVACADELAALEQHIARAFREAPGAEGATCNLLGSLVPGACPTLAPELVARTVQTRARCIALPRLGNERERVPADFQLTVRRGKQLRGLDRDPRYVLALYAEGQVVFHGRHWVSATERRDGRTSHDALAAVYARFRALDWFDRKGGDWDAERCSPEDDLGNLLTLVAGGRQRMVVDRDGCRGPFTRSELAALIDAAETASGLAAWTAPQPAYADRGVQVWTVP
jgi:hypothetical protein